MHAFVLLGVSGSRMSTAGVQIAARLSWPYLEEDGFHSPANLKKIYEGIHLSDSDRALAIDALCRAINIQAQPCVIVACSLLTGSARRRLENAVLRRVHFIQLRDPIADEIAARLGRPQSHVEAPPSGPAVGGSDESIEIYADRNLDVVTTRVVTRVRTLAGAYPQ